MKIEHGKTLHKERGYAECTFGDLEMNRAIASRYDQLANSFLGTVHIASTR